ncbi:MAG: AAA family ATPase [Proteobacteria bacterium]|nr:MAG: AAA family ATPase [Pseudomonadota bacterium]
MNILVAGIHGVGKTFLATQCAEQLGFIYVSASQLIREERDFATWNIDKYVGEIDENQVALISAVQRHNSNGRRLLLDGHFVLLDQGGRTSQIEASVFASLRLDRVILIENDLDTILFRNESRGSQRWSANLIKDLLSAERAHAQSVCRELELDLVVLMAPTVESFSKAVANGTV